MSLGSLPLLLVTVKTFVRRPEHVASAIMQLISNGANGAIVVSENNQEPYTIEFPNYTALKVPA